MLAQRLDERHSQFGTVTIIEMIYPTTSYKVIVASTKFQNFNRLICQVREQYVVYDFVSLIGEVGGYLGLLLGISMLSLYDYGIEFMAKMKK